MRLTYLAIASLVLASTAATAGGSPSPASQPAKPACVASLQKIEGSKGYKIARKCPSSVVMAQQPVVDGMGQSEGGVSPWLLGGLSALAVVGGIVLASTSP